MCPETLVPSSRSMCGKKQRLEYEIVALQQDERLEHCTVGGIALTSPLTIRKHKHRMASSIGRGPDYSAEGRGFEPQTEPTLRVLK